MEETT